LKHDAHGRPLGGPAISATSHFFPTGSLSLNQRRGTAAAVADRFAFTLECIRQHYVGQALEKENAELRRANAILRTASAFFAAELDRH